MQSSSSTDVPWLWQHVEEVSMDKMLNPQLLLTAVPSVSEWMSAGM